MAESMRDLLYSTTNMTAVFSPRAHVQAMLQFEAALARAEAQGGVIPPEVATRIGEMCRVDLFDVESLYHEATLAGTTAIPLVRALTAKVQGDAQKFVHWGATSQDAIDSALMLQMRDGLDLLIKELLDVCATCATLAEHHRKTLMAGRTLLQQALPMTFGLKAAQWLAMTTRQVEAVRMQQAHSLALQFGGASGTLASLGANGLHVSELLAKELELPLPDQPWHTERDRIAHIATTLGIVAGTMGKIAEDIVLLAQTEVGEVAEGKTPGKGTSSTLPQKHNPVDAIYALASARLALSVVPTLLNTMIQEHERAVGAWQAEWVALPDLFCYTASAVERIKHALSHIHIDASRMRANLELTKGLVMAESLSIVLAAHIGKSEAQHLVQQACNRALEAGQYLGQVAHKDERMSSILSPQEIDHALDPTEYLGSADVFINHALDAYRSILKMNVEEGERL